MSSKLPALESLKQWFKDNPQSQPKSGPQGWYMRHDPTNGEMVPTRVPSATMVGRLPSDLETQITQNETLAQARENASINDATMGMQFFGRSRKPPLIEDPFYKLYLPDGISPSAVVNTDMTGALAQQLARLEGLYPGVTNRILHVTTGRLDPEARTAAWYHDVGRAAGKPGNNFYEIGAPADNQLMRQALGPGFRGSNGGFLRGGLEPVDDPYLAGRMLYGDRLAGTMTHELGHAVHYSMNDFIKGLSNDDAAFSNGGVGQRWLALNQNLALNPQSISGYAVDSARQSMNANGPGFSTAREPFAELFTLARSEPGMDIGSGNPAVRGAAIRALTGNRSDRMGMQLMDHLNNFNSTEKALRNSGWNEVGAAAPDLAMQIGLPALAGLLASKTHGNAHAALQGAALGGGLGSLAGPEGTLIGGALGAGAGLARQLL